MNSVPFKLITSSGILFQGDAEAVTLASSSGEIQILANHVDCYSLLGIGAMKASSVNETWIVIKGVFAVREGRVEILADRAFSLQSDEAKNLKAEFVGLQTKLEKSEISDSAEYHSLKDTYEAARIVNKLI
jgi:ATP synthase F1 epsilon subunit